MRKRLAPSHDLCARMRFVPADDSAWRSELIEKETAELGEDKQWEHPFWRYQFGLTRFDLDDIAAYIDMSAKPETWKFRRLPLGEREEVSYLLKQKRDDAAYRHAFSHGVTGLDNPATPEGERLASLLSSPAKDRTAKQRDAIIEAAEDYAASTIAEVGRACYAGSQDLTDLEKKHCG